MESEIFLPMYYLMLLTVTVLLFSITVRLKEIYVNKLQMVKRIDTPLLMKEVDCLKTRRGIWQIYLIPDSVLDCLHLYFCYGKGRCLFYYFGILVFLFQSNSFNVSYFLQPINHQRRFPDKISFVDPVYSYYGLDVGKIYFLSLS